MSQIRDFIGTPAVVAVVVDFKDRVQICHLYHVHLLQRTLTAGNKRLDFIELLNIKNKVKHPVILVMFDGLSICSSASVSVPSVKNISECGTL